MTDEEIEAGNLKWEPTGSVTIRKLSSGNFAMFHTGGRSTPFWIGPAEDLIAAYESRPPVPQRVAPPPKPLTGLAATMEFLI